MSRWSDLAAEQDRAVLALVSTALQRRARALKPLLDPEDASRLRAAILGGDSGRLHELVSEMNLKAS